MVSESARIKEDYGLSNEALQVLRQTVTQIKDLNKSVKKKPDNELLIMRSEDIADAILGNIGPNQFIRPTETES
jgi:hypothetical protein